ncbi:hypothetical protein GHT06_008986 [Daphnia sinensis]|uniref:Uncharacterized protein n=1 Tax=Daphnia sinensis TaxID=1820382 RepID=A0AAD5LNB2_9CRUS|nr:hypothetical protein GHT06_008986 [Daphnia sinensis]
MKTILFRKPKKLNVPIILNNFQFRQSTASDAIEVQVQANTLKDGDLETNVLHGDTKEASIDLLRWKEDRLRGPFFAVNCRSVRIGSHKFTPAERVLFSSEGIKLEAPIFYAHDQPPQNDIVWVDVAIPAQHLLRMEAHFNRQLPVIFLTVASSLCHRVSSGLHYEEY